MTESRHLFTSEAVAAGHPDKVADQISDAILDSILDKDPYGRVACETLVTTGLVIIAGEITTECYVDIPRVARETIRDIGYTDPHLGFDWETCGVLVTIDDQSGDIAQGVGKQGEDVMGAGDQGLMFGYATDETEEMMPLTLVLARKLMRRLENARVVGELKYLRPDGKCQVTVEYDERKPIAVRTVVLSTQHSPDVRYEKLREEIIEKIIRDVIPAKLLDETVYHINPTGRFVLGGPVADTGLTGRKIIVDTYGGRGSHGGGCFSGKDPTKVDRSASLAARYVAKNVVAAGLASECEVQLAYAIGVTEPVSVLVETNGTGAVSDELLSELVMRHFDLTPGGIIKSLDLRRPIYRDMARYGYFGRSGDSFTWERTDKVEILRKEAQID